MKKTTILSQAKKLYFLGIGGFGMSALAGLLHKEGKDVRGSDRVSSPLTKLLEKQGINVKVSKNSTTLPPTDALIFSEAVPPHHPMRKKAEKQGIPQLSYFQALGQWSENYKQVFAVCGTNGKTTTTAMLSEIFREAKKNPTAIVGSPVKNFGKNFLAGSKGYFIVEACEYRKNFLSLTPDMVALTNISAEHLDYFKNLNHIIKTFHEFIKKIPEGGTLILNNDDPVSRKNFHATQRLNVVTYGSKHASHIQAKNIRAEEGMTIFDLHHHKTQEKQTIRLRLPGEFNIQNALAAAALASCAHIPINTIKKALEKFRGTWRRFELVGTYKKAPVISDYAHHPDGIQVTLTAARSFYPRKRIVAVFQPHQRNRTKKLFTQFIDSLSQADVVILPKIFEVAGRENKDDTISSKQLCQALKKKGTESYACKNLGEAQKLLASLTATNDLILCMGAGDIYTLASQLTHS